MTEIRDEAYYRAYGHSLHGAVDKLNDVDGVWPDSLMRRGDAPAMIHCPKCNELAETISSESVHWRRSSPTEYERFAGHMAWVIGLEPCGHSFAYYPKQQSAG